MITFEYTETYGWEAAARGMRNPMNSWTKGDTEIKYSTLTFEEFYPGCQALVSHPCEPYPSIGENDMGLMKRLRSAGTDHRKYLRMIGVSVDITAPLYWWKEFDTYKVGTVANSCSTMHKIHTKEFTVNDFSHEHLFSKNDMIPEKFREDISMDNTLTAVDVDGHACFYTPLGLLSMTCDVLNGYRNAFLVATKAGETEIAKNYWWQMIQLLPSSYNQRRTVTLNYEVLNNQYKSRKNHKLDEWRSYCEWIKALPYSNLIVGEIDE